MYAIRDMALWQKIWKRFSTAFTSLKKSTKYPGLRAERHRHRSFLCKRIVYLHGGEIFARNNHRQGGFIPYVDAADSRRTGRDEWGSGYSLIVYIYRILCNLEDTQKKETILIVEDNKDMRSYIRTLLVGDYRLFEAGDGQGGP